MTRYGSIGVFFIPFSRCFKLEQEGIPERTLFQCETKKLKVAGPPRFLYDPLGEAIPYEPSFHVSRGSEFNLQDLPL